MQPTAAEIDVLYRLTKPGASTVSVARDLEITEHAVKARLRSLYRRLGVNDRLQAYAKLHPPD